MFCLPAILPIALDQNNHIATLSDAAGDLKLRLNFGNGCVIDQLEVQGRQVLGEKEAAWTGIQVGGKWYTSAALTHPPTVSQSGNVLRVTGLEYEDIQENWTFSVKKDAIDWKIDRRYLSSQTLDATAMPLIAFKDMSTWTGAILGSGGVAWCKLLDSPNSTYGVQTASATFWNRDSDPILHVATKTSGFQAMRFTRDPSGRFAVASCSTKSKLVPKRQQTRFQRTQQDIWAPFPVKASETVSTTVEFKAASYQDVYGRGDFKGLDTRGITEMINTIGRIGVIDDGLVGTNGWYSGYICLHEPWQARIGTTIDDPNYTRSEAEFLDYAREHAVKPDGMVMSRWYYNGGDAQPGTFDEHTGFYEAQWGRLMDSQSSYVWNVSDQFDQTGDKAWVAKQKTSCEAALDYLLKRDTRGNGLVEMQNKLIREKRSSDWLDIVWASYENAFVNAQLYGALLHWASVEQVLGDAPRAKYYRDFAAKMKATFNKPIDQGGFWDPAKGWYVYWRDADGSIHGDNLTVEVNLTALADGIGDDPARRKSLLGEIEKRMNAESLMSWPACFESFAPGEGADDQFPTYENGDIFLSWAEYGVHAYAETDPEIAVKYVKRLVDQYNKDGLAFQRYLRSNGQGAGDDILAGNCNVITGLYREIYGIKPKYNRLYLEPHLTPELDGTEVKYNFRGTPLRVLLSVGDYAMQSGGRVVKSPVAFGVDFTPKQVTFFPGERENPGLTLGLPVTANASVSFGNWKDDKSFAITSEKEGTVSVTFPGGSPIRVVSGGKTVATVPGSGGSFKVNCQAGIPRQFQVIG